MKKTGIVTDSHSGMTHEEAEKLGIKVIPMPFFLNEVCYHENIEITREEFFERVEAGESVSTTQASPQEVMDVWDEALAECEKILHFPMSSGLSGSCATAQALACEDKYEGRVFVMDLGRISVPLVCIIYDTLRMIEKGMEAEEIRDVLNAHAGDFDIYVGVDDISFLQRGGRISSATAFIGKMLNIKPMLHLKSGLLEKHKECRGAVKLHKEMIAAIKAELETTFKEGVDEGRVQVIAACCAKREIADAWEKEVREAFPDMKVIYGDLSLGIACHLGPGGIGVGCSMSPKESV